MSPGASLDLAPGPSSRTPPLSHAIQCPGHPRPVELSRSPHVFFKALLFVRPSHLLWSHPSPTCRCCRWFCFFSPSSCCLTAILESFSFRVHLKSTSSFCPHPALLCPSGHLWHTGATCQGSSVKGKQGHRVSSCFRLSSGFQACLEQNPSVSFCLPPESHPSALCLADLQTLHGPLVLFLASGLCIQITFSLAVLPHLCLAQCCVT